MAVSYADALAFAALTLTKHAPVGAPHSPVTSLIAAYRFSAFVVVLAKGSEPVVGASVTEPELVVKGSLVAAVELVTVTTAPATVAVAFPFAVVLLPNKE